jgi:hypothetical protein
LIFTLFINLHYLRLFESYMKFTKAQSFCISNKFRILKCLSLQMKIMYMSYYEYDIFKCFP